MARLLDQAPGAPGIPPRWTSSAKDGVGTALSPKSPVWFTLSHGILNEVYYPRVDSACCRDLGLIVTGPGGYFAEEKRACEAVTQAVEPGVPAFTVESTARDGAFTLRKRVVSDPARAAVLMEVAFEPGTGAADDWHVHALLAPHLVNGGAGNSGWIGSHNGAEMLFAKGDGRFLALACSTGWRARSAGFVGASDGWQQLRENGRIDTPAYARADGGNVALTGEIALAPGTPAVIALAFGQNEIEAAERARASLAAGIDAAWDSYVQTWRAWQAGLHPLDGTAYRTSTAVLATHRAADRPGAAVASLSIPWGFSKGDGDLGGYHLVWPRDLVETAGGFLGAGDRREALAILGYLAEVQLPSGRWPQNLWLDGEPYWPGVQMDEVAFPLILAEMVYRHTHLSKKRLRDFLPMLRRAAGYVLMHGPVTAEDRWEEDAGFSPFTLAVEITGLLACAELFEALGEPEQARHLRETADCWNEQIEAWTFAGDKDICAAAGVEGYYVRIAPPAATDNADPVDGATRIANRAGADAHRDADDVLSPDALALVRFGLRAPDDPRIVQTVQAIDATLKVELPQGPMWYRYTGDGYGEHDDGAPYDGIGRGRPWPLLAGERAHYELAAGNRPAALALLATLEASANQGGMLPEQTWDADDIPARELFRGRPSGSAMPLVWAHAEHIKLCRSLADGAVFDMPPQTRARYVEAHTPGAIRIWRFNNRVTHLPANRRLRILLDAPALVHWSRDGWATATDTLTVPSGLGSHFADLGPEELAPGAVVSFTIYWPETDTWQHEDFRVEISAPIKRDRTCRSG